MNNTKRNIFRTIAAVAAVAALGTAMAFTSACGASIKDTEAKVTIDTLNTCGKTTDAEGNEVGNTANDGWLGAAQSQTDVTLTVKDGGYTLTKKVYSDMANSFMAALNPEEIEIVYTFTGTVTAMEGTTYTLAAATACTYSEDWGVFNGNAMAPTLVNKSGDNTTDAECLNYFYGPYWNKNGNKEMKVTVTEGVLSFEGFTFEEE